MTKQAQANRLDYFDIAKGIGIISVIIGHLGLTVVNKFVFSFHMPLFFLISGYFLSTKTDFTTFVKRKAQHLLIPYAFTCLCIISLSILKNIVRGNYNCIFYDIKMWLYASLYGSGNEYTSPFYIKSIGAIWFLLAMFFAIIVVRYAIDTKYSAIIILTVAYIGYKTAQFIWLPFSIQAGMTASLFVYIGYLCKKEQVFLQKPPAFIPAFMLAVWGFCVIFGGRLYMVGNAYNNGLLDIIGAIFATYIILLFCKKLESISIIKNVLTFYGKNSLIVLSFHLIELDMGPWGRIYDLLNSFGIPRASVLCTLIILAFKIAWATFGILLVKHVKILSKIYGLI